MKTPQLPFPKLSEALGIPNEVWLKREDKHHYGSHKGRSIPLMINEYKRAGVRQFIVSSSGNAALAALTTVATHNKNKAADPLTLKILVGNKIDGEKFAKLKNGAPEAHVTIEQVENPKQTAFQMEKENLGTWLRQSTDDKALVGYHDLAAELGKIPNLSAVFVPTSSGTTAQGLYEGFEELGLNPEIHIVQTTSCHPIVDYVITRSLAAASDRGNPQSTEPNHGIPTASGLGMTQETSLATAIVDQVAHRKEKVSEAIKNSRGYGWIATNEEIEAAMKLAHDASGIQISPNSALSIVALMHAIKTGKTWAGPVVCLITGP